MRKVLFIVFITIAFILGKGNYRELNDLAIINSVAVEYNVVNEKYTIYMKEIIPRKDDLGINYDYKYYKANGNSINTALENLKKKSKKKLYYKKTKYLITNINNSNYINELLGINPKYIYHPSSDLFIKLKETKY